MSNLLRYLILILVLWNVPAYCLIYIGPGIGTLTSYLTFLLLVLFYVFNKKEKVLFPFILLGISYFLLSGLNYHEVSGYMYRYYMEFVKYIICIVAGTEVLRRTKIEDLYYILLLGVVSIIIQAAIFPDNHGRYSGFYLNSNAAAFICLIGFALSFGIKQTSMKLLGQAIFTMGGIVTLSRSFFLIWTGILLISVILNKKNLVGIVAGLAVLMVVITSASYLQLNEKRFSWINSVAENKGVDIGELGENSRPETWSLFYDKIKSKPLLGHGYRSFKGFNPLRLGENPVSVHNSFLLVFGESGIIPLLLMLGVYAFLIFKANKLLRLRPEYLFISLILFARLLVSHNYFDSYYLLFFSMWLYMQLTDAELEMNKLGKYYIKVRAGLAAS